MQMDWPLSCAGPCKVNLGDSRTWVANWGLIKVLH
uniref:Uncharacterized protein n=1 Tax=Arundo donax TaxID=35708 RepID=A0A0A8YXW4_ARUDO